MAPHILVFPFPAQGHLIPMLDLSHHLAARGLSITILVTPTLLPLLDPYLSPSISPLVLTLPSHPSLPPGIEQVRDLPSPNLTAALMEALSFLRPQILAWARSHPNPPAAILSEFFLGWTHHLAADLGVPRIVFYSSNTVLAALMDCLFRRGHRHGAGLVGTFPYDHLPSIYRRYAASGGTPEWEFAKDAMLANAACWGAVFNTFEALEPDSLARYREDAGRIRDESVPESEGNLGIREESARWGPPSPPRVWAVGPIPPAVPAAGRGGRSSVPVADLTAWLDSSPPRSVIYVCFGSQFWPTLAQARAISSALELSKARFVWAVGPDRTVAGGEEEAEAEAVVPEGFEERVAGRVLVVRGWAPQVALLGHGAVGAFLTHCGWNSVLEGMAAGVVLLAWPMTADQFVNARLLVEEAGVAVRVCEGGGAVPEAEAVARVMDEAVGVEEGEGKGKGAEMRERAGEMGRRVKEAVGEGGSSFMDLEGLVKEVWEITRKE